MNDLKISELFPEVFAVKGNHSFEVQDCDFYVYGAAHSTTCAQDDAIQVAVLAYDSNQELIARLQADNELLREALIDADKWLNIDNDYDQSPLCNKVYEALAATAKG